MGLADRIRHQDDGQSVGDIAIHTWTAAFSLYCFGEATRTQVVNVFNLTTEDEGGLDTLKTSYDSLSTKADKVEFLNKLESAGLFYETGIIDKTKYKSIMGLTD